ncbi:MAG TPA: ATP-binding protein [bacterium]
MTIRAKLIATLLLIALLPILPIYFLVKDLLRKSQDIGFNQNVESALEHAADISRELYAIYKNETLNFARDLAASEMISNLLHGETRVASQRLQAVTFMKQCKLDVFDANGDLVFSFSAANDHIFPPLYEATIKSLGSKEADFVHLSDDPGHIAAVAPVKEKGTLPGLVVVTRLVDEKFTRGFQQVVNVNQMFKTIGFLEEEVTRGFLLYFFAIYAPIAALSIGLGIYFSRKITTPLLLLVNGTKKVAEGNWEHRVAVTSNDEVGELVAAFNHMIATLKEKQDQVIALEKMAVWREIARVLAHEIKNPLTPIQLTVQQMKDKYAGDDEAYRKLLAECSQIVNDEIESLRTLVREFSEFARMPKLNLAPGNLNELVEEVSKLYTDRKVQIAVDSSIPEFNFDYEKMRRVLINLIENGLDSMNEKAGGVLKVETKNESGFAALQVSDEGNGIPPELQSRIFEPYFSTKKTGMGLGLAIVKRIIDEHHGKISIESHIEKGTTFKIDIPIQINIREGK